MTEPIAQQVARLLAVLPVDCVSRRTLRGLLPDHDRARFAINDTLRRLAHAGLVRREPRAGAAGGVIHVLDRETLRRIGDGEVFVTSAGVALARQEAS